MCVAAVAVAANLRFHLWFTSGFYAAELADQRRHVAGLVRGADILFVSLLLMGAVAIHGVSTPYTTLLIAVRRRKPVRVFAYRTHHYPSRLRHQGLRDKGQRGIGVKGPLLVHLVTNWVTHSKA